MLKALRPLLERFWVWLGGELPLAGPGLVTEPGPDQSVYVVQPGDTLNSIARRFSTSIWVLADLNELDDLSLVHVGQRLLVPRPGASLSVSAPVPPPEPEPPVELEAGPFVYVVRTGDTLGAIAHRFGAPLVLLVEVNRIQDPDLIRAGQRLLIPGPQPEAPPEVQPSPLPAPGPVAVSPLPTPIAIPLPLPEPEPSAPEPAPEALPVPSPEPLFEPAPPSPLPEAVPEPQPEPLLGRFVYVVQPGDTLLALARRFNVTLRAIIEANDIEDPNLIRVGQRLVIPGISLPVTPPSTPTPAPAQPAPVHPPDTTRPPGVVLSPIAWPQDAIRAIYVSYFAIGHEAHRRRVIEILTKTEINALVIDVKGDHGLISYPTRVALAHDLGAARPTARDFDELMDFFKANGVYTIARIVAFKDHPLANGHPEWAVQRQEGGLWHDQEKLAWADPFAQAAWEYNADLAEEAAQRGFDEIQFDYIRFPTPSQEGVPSFSQPASRELRVAAITAFLSYVRGRLGPLGVRVAADVFGYTCWRKDDTLIGQDIERLAQYLDVLCPMLYPSTFGSGIPGYKNAIAYPYEVVYESLKRAVRQVEPLGCCARPWIQDFPDYRFDKRVYGPAEIHAQMQASFDGGGIGYMAWDPKVKYTIEAYFKNAIDMSPLDDYN